MTNTPSDGRAKRIDDGHSGDESLHPYRSIIAYTDTPAGPEGCLPKCLGEISLAPNDIAPHDRGDGSDLSSTGAFGRLKITVEDCYATFAADVAARLPYDSSSDRTADVL